MPAMEEEVGDPGRDQHLRTPIQGVTFSHAAEIQLGARSQKTDRLQFPIQFQVLAANVRQQLVNLFRCRKATGARLKSPESYQRTCRDVHCAARCRAPGDAPAEQLKQPGFHHTCPLEGVAIDAAHFTVRPIDRQLVLETLNEVQCLRSGLHRSGVLPGIEEYVEFAGHGATSDLQQIIASRLRLARGSRERTQRPLPLHPIAVRSVPRSPIRLGGTDADLFCDAHSWECHNHARNLE